MSIARRWRGSTPLRLQLLENKTLPSITAIGSDAGSMPEVRVFDSETGALMRSFLAYDASFRGGVRVALGNVTADGIEEIITGPGPGGGPNVRIFNGQTGELLRSFFAFDPSFTGGVFVAFGLRYSNHIIPPNPFPPSIAQIIVGADAGGGPHVRVFDAIDGAITKEFFAYDASFHGGVRVATHLIDGHPSDIITGAGPGGGPHVKVFSGNDRAELQSFFAYDSGFRGGVYVASSGNSIVTSPGSTGGPHVRVFDSNAHVTNEFFAYDPGFRGGVRVSVVGDMNGDAVSDIVTTPGPGGGPDVRYFSGATGSLLNEYFANDPSFVGGAFVAGG